MSNILSPRHVFGLKGDVTSNVFHLDDNTIIYPAGNFIVVYSIDSKTQSLIPCSPDSIGITAMALSRSRKFLAVAEQSDKAMISIIELQGHANKRRSKPLVTSEAQSSRYVSLAWSPNDDWLVAQGAEPEWKLVLWRSPALQRSQVMFSDKVLSNNQGEAYQCLFHPVNGETVTVIGASVNRVLRLADEREGLLKPASYGMGKAAESQAKSLTCHCWLIDGDMSRMLLGTELGEVYVLDYDRNWEPIRVLNCPEGVGATSIAAYNNGKAFAVGGTQGTVAFFAAQDNEKEPYRMVRSVQIKGETGSVRAISVSPSEESLVLSTSTNQLWVLEFSNAELASKADEAPSKLLVAAFHSGEVTGLDTCVRKPLLVSCSGTPEDSSIKMWNYLERTCELSVRFEEQPLCVSLHPTGYVLLAGFTDKLRLMTVLMDDLKPVREYPVKGCRECRFSTGGQFFAATDPTNHTVKVWATFSGEQVAELSRHANKVWSIQWNAEDTKLVTCSSDGIVIEWDMRGYRPLRLHQTRGIYYTSAVFGLDAKTLMAAGGDKGIKELGEDGDVLRHAFQEEEFSQIVLADSGKMVFGATESGIVKALKLPLTGEVVAPPIKAHAIVAGSQNYCVSRMILGDSGSLCVTAGHDGSLVVFSVNRDRDANADKGGERGREAMPLAEEVLVTKVDLEEKRRNMLELEQRVSDNQSKYEWEMTLLENKMQEEIHKLTSKFTDELEKDRRNYAKLSSEKGEMETMYDDKIRAAEQQQRTELQTLEAQYQEKIQLEAQRYQELVQEMERMKEQYEESDTFLHDSHQRKMEELAEEYNKQLREEQERSDRLEQQKQEMAREYEEMRQLMEEDADREIEDLTHYYKVALAREREDAAGLSVKNTSMNQTREELEQKIDKLKQQIRSLFSEEKQQYNQIQAHEKDKETLRKEMREREETIAEKEKRIYDLKKKNQELEKFKWMLDYKIKDLRTMIEPREAEIGAMKEQVKEMDLELERYQKQNASLELTISELKLRMQALQGEQQAQGTRLDATGQVIRRFQRDLFNAVQALGDVKALKAKVKALYQEYAEAEAEELETVVEAESEYGRQRDYLEQTVESLKRKLAKDVDKARADNMRIMAEHVALVQEINELRREMKAVRAGMPGTTNTGAEARGLGKGAAGGVQRSGSLLPPLRRGAGSGPQRAGSLRGAGLRSVGGSGRASPAVMDGEMLAQMDAMRVSQEGAGVDGNGAWVAGAGRRSRPASGGLPPLGGGAEGMALATDGGMPHAEGSEPFARLEGSYEDVGAEGATVDGAGGVDASMGEDGAEMGAEMGDVGDEMGEELGPEEEFLAPDNGVEEADADAEGPMDEGDEGEGEDEGYGDGDEGAEVGEGEEVGDDEAGA